MKALKHFITITHHRHLVRKGCFKVGLYWQGLTHDLSKFSPTEFLMGIQYYQGDRSPNNAEKEAKERKEIAQREEAYGKHIAPYLGLCFVAGDIEIRPLPTVMSVYEEGEAMHHCIYRMKYWQRTDTLLMSARDKEGKRLESIEVNLRDYKVIQSRGLQNHHTEFHKEIVALVKKNMNQIKRIRKAI